MEKLALSITEAALLLGVSRPTMYAIARRKDFDAVFKLALAHLSTEVSSKNGLRVKQRDQEYERAKKSCPGVVTPGRQQTSGERVIHGKTQNVQLGHSRH